MNKSNTILLYGASGHGLVVADIVQMAEKCPVRFLDDNKTGEFHFIEVVHPSSVDFSLHSLIVTVGKNKTRKHIVDGINAQYMNAIHPQAIVSKLSTRGVGNVFMPGSIVNAKVQIGDHCIINTNASIDHECSIESFVHISPGVSTAGNVHIGEGAHIGIGATIIQGIRIGKWATIGAGAVVIRDVADYDTVVGNPARSIRK